MLGCGMGPGGAAGRRWFGGAVLGIALLMLLAGQTVLQGRLAGMGFFLYWLTCLCLTGLAVLVALADARASRAELRREKRELLEQTIKQIQDEASARKARSRKANG